MSSCHKINKFFRHFLNVTIVFSVIFYIPLFSLVFAATTYTVTSSDDFKKGLFTNTEADSIEGSVQMKTSGSWGPRIMTTPNYGLSNGSAFVSDGKDIYVLVGMDQYFMKYIAAENRWVELAKAPYTTESGATLTLLGNYVYAMFGNYYTYFSRYSILTNTWENLASTPDTISAGASLVTDGTSVYASRGGYTDFWKYNVTTNTWSLLTNSPGAFYHGADLIYYNGYIYSPRAGNNTQMYRYTIADDSWTTLGTVPYNINYQQNADMKNGYIYYLGYDQNVFYRYNIAGDSWSSIAAPPQNTRYGGVVYTAATDQLYVFRGNGTYEFWKYNEVSNTFQGPKDLPAAPGSGADLVYYNGALYSPRGGNTNVFSKYTIATDTWTNLGATPFNFYYDTRATVAGSLIYFIRGGNTTDFYSYNPANDTWTQLTAITGATDVGSCAVYPGSGDYIYVTRGNWSRTFYRYSITGNSWSTMTNIPDNAEASEGARLVTDGTDIYYLSGARTNVMLKYDIDGGVGGTWSTVTTLPYTPNWGTDAVYYSGKIYVQAGFYKSDFYEYDISQQIWRNLDPVGQYYYYKAGPYNGGSLESDGAGHFYSIYGNNILNVNLYTVAAQNYRASGTWTSEAIDLDYVDSWESDSFITSYTAPSSAGISFQTRTSADQITWSDWTGISGRNIVSSPARYLQILASFTAPSGYNSTPRLDSVAFNYNGDTIAPHNPTTFTAQSQQIGGAALTSGQTYSYTHPYFSWSGAVDDETDVAGYYVSFSTSPSANPFTVGSYQTTTTYSSNEPLTAGTYYLRISTKDTHNNVSSPITGFTYVYLGVPQTSLTFSTTADFIAGSTSNINLANDVLKLAGKSSFWLEQRANYIPSYVTYVSNMAYVSSTGKIYAFRGNDTVTFYEYDIATDTWTPKADAPATVYYGGGVVEGPTGYLYGFRGRDTNTFWLYDINANTWSDVAAANIPLTASYGTSMVYDGTRYIYAIRGNSDDSVFRYDTQDDKWISLTAADFGAPTNSPNNLIGNGGTMAYDGTDKIYVIQGGCRYAMSVYSISSGTWTVMQNLPFESCGYGQLAYEPASNALFYLPSNGKSYFYKYDITAGSWSTLPEGPTTFSAGNMMRTVGNTIYVLKGNWDTRFYVFDVSRNSWMTPSRGFFDYDGLYLGTSIRGFGYGAKMIKADGDNYYLTRGALDNQFVKYNSSTGVVTPLHPVPVGLDAGGNMVLDTVHNKIYLVASSYIRSLFVYDIDSNDWSEVTSDPPPVDVGPGSSMVFDGTQYIYWTRGSNTSTYYRYNTTGTAGTRWETRTGSPATLYYGSVQVLKNGTIYALRGGNNNPNGFYSYDRTGNSWTTLESLNDAVYNDGFLADGGGDTLYSCIGRNTTTCYQYSLSSGHWTSMPSAPANIYTGGYAVSNGSNQLYVIAGGGTNTFSDGLYHYIIQTEDSSFEEEGTYISPVHDLTEAYRLANISVGYTAPSNTSVLVSTRTSADNTTWSEWALTSDEKALGNNHQYKINSSAARYIQVKLTLKSLDSIYSPTIYDYTINYQSDTTRPTNPTQLVGAYTDSGKSTLITSGTWNYVPTPYFDWTDAEETNGASDTATGSGVIGYYVYFGTEPTADPVSLGTSTTASEYTASSLVSGNTYYLRIKTVDDAGNVSENSWQPFIYKYDNSVPTAPDDLVVDPSGYSATNSFDFSWAAVTDTGEDGVTYCYKTGATSGTYSTDQCTTNLYANDVPSYQSGANTFYVRTKDIANNYSTYTTVSYYYSSGAPSPVTNLAVTPTSNSDNSFAFSWGVPSFYFGAEANLTYYFSVNAKPTTSSVTETKLRYLTAGAYATLPGTNTLYVVAKDEAGNIDYNQYASIDFTANTTAPGLPTEFDIADVSVKDTKSWKLAISWEAPASQGSGVAAYKIYRSLNNSSFSYLATTAGISYVDTGLTQAVHYYKVQACDSANNCGEFSSVVSLYPDGKFTVPAPLVDEPTVTDITTKKATISWTTSRDSDSKVAYGTKSGDYLSEEVSNSDQDTDHELILTNLRPGTKYYYTAKWTDEDGNTGESDEYTFETADAPSIKEAKASNISLYTATITFTSINAYKAEIHYGKTSSFGATKDISVGASESKYSVQLEDLEDGSKYFYKIVLSDSENAEYDGDTYSFETLPRPKITDVQITQIKSQAQPTIFISWTTNTSVTSVVHYYPAGDPGKALDEVNINLQTGKHRTLVKNLLPDTAYSIVVSGRDLVGNEAVSEVIAYHTAVDTRAPLIGNMKVEGAIMQIGSGESQQKQAQLTVSWDTDEPSTSQVEFGEGSSATYSQRTQEDTTLAYNHIVVISNLSPSKVYHLRIVSKDKLGNPGRSVDRVTITPKATDSALDLVMSNLQQVFGPIANINK